MYIHTLNLKCVNDYENVGKSVTEKNFQPYELGVVAE